MSYVMPGRYRHYKGGEYNVHGLGLHESEFDKYVVYEPMTPGSKLDDTEVKFWIRPLENFNEMVKVRRWKRIPFFKREIERFKFKPTIGQTMQMLNEANYQRMKMMMQLEAFPSWIVYDEADTKEPWQK